MYFQIVMLSVFLIFNSSVLSSQPATDFSDGIIGEWKGTGTLFGMEASFSMHWSNELNDQFIKLDFENSFKDGSGTNRTMNAQAFYDIKKSRGYWFDSRGLILPLRLELHERTMTVYWGEAATEQGKTLYTIDSAKSIHVEDYVLREGEFAPFGSAIYTKK